MDQPVIGSGFAELMSLTTGRARPASRAQEAMLAVLAIAAGLVLAAVWGAAAGSSSMSLAVANLYKVPMVILLSAVTALPVGLVVLRLTNAKLSGHALASTFAASIFGGTLMLATLAPLVAIYYHTSAKAGIPLAIGSVFVSLATAAMLFASSVAKRLDGQRGASLLAVVILVAVFLAALLQFIVLASPIIGLHGTALEGGFDGLHL